MKIQELLGEKYEEGMTPEEQLKALAEIEASTQEPTPDAGQIEALKRENEKLKRDREKANKEAAEYKREKMATMNESERLAADLKAGQDELKQKIADLEREKLLVSAQTKFLTAGFEVSLAEKAALAIADGDIDSLLLFQKQHIEKLMKGQRAETLRQTPKPTAAGGATSTPKEMSAEQFSKMSTKDVIALKRDNPDLYNEMMNNGG